MDVCEKVKKSSNNATQLCFCTVHEKDFLESYTLGTTAKAEKVPIWRYPHKIYKYCFKSSQIIFKEKAFTSSHSLCYELL